MLFRSNSAKAFSILSSGLYANKIRAIIRELSTNAYDSHVAAGCADRPFEVHLPTSLEPWFSVRDYGVGLSHQQVVNIYTTYFESTKTGSNDFVGALGLGSKSPFSYTENFGVTAVQNGHMGVYTALIDRIAKTVDKQTLDAILDEKATQREKLARVLDAKLGAPGTRRERANLFEKLYTPKQQTEFKNGTSLEVIERPKLDDDNRPVIGKNGLPVMETVKLQDVYDKGGAQAVEYEEIGRAHV